MLCDFEGLHSHLMWHLRHITGDLALQTHSLALSFFLSLSLYLSSFFSFSCSVLPTFPKTDNINSSWMNLVHTFPAFLSCHSRAHFAPSDDYQWMVIAFGKEIISNNAIALSIGAVPNDRIEIMMAVKLKDREK